MKQSYEIKHYNSKPARLDKLEQLRNRPQTKALRRRAFKKYLSVQYTKRLIALNSPMRTSYERIFDCASILIQKDNKITAKYCGDRWCKVCGSIRTAKAINGYYHQIKALKDVHFVTLTSLNVLDDDLRYEIQNMNESWRKILDRMRKRGVKVRGLRKLECTYNKYRDDYNPHFHVIVEGKDRAELLLSDWLDLHPRASRSGQDIRPADEGSIMEMFKYSMKLPANVDDLDDQMIRGADIIFQAMRRRRTLQPFGGIKKVSEEIDDLDATIETDEMVDRMYIWVGHDWYDNETGEALSGFMPDDNESDGNIYNNTCNQIKYN